MVYPVTFLPVGITVLVEEGATLKQAAEEAACFFDSPCGGHGTCGKCQIRYRERPSAEKPHPEWISALACQTRVDRTLEVMIPDATMRRSFPGGTQRMFARPFTGVCGLAVDLGTTSVAACLVPQTGDQGVSPVVCAWNRQTRFGADVISRIDAARTDAASRRSLQRDAAETIDGLLRELRFANGNAPCSIASILVAGNPAMQQLFLGMDCTLLGESPFAPAFTASPPHVLARSLGLNEAPDAVVRVFPQISGFVGGDTVAGILSTRLTSCNRPALLVDIGTNGEMALWANGELTVASAAAGPAFEGARISQGMRAVPGAIDHVWSEAGKLCVGTVGGMPPRGICGSGLLDAVAELLCQGRLDPSGAFCPEMESVSLADGVLLQQRDVREVQLAVSAIRSGIEILLAEAGFSAASLETVLLAGTFGSLLSVSSAQRVGLLPPASQLPTDRIHPVGNAALRGAILALRSPEAREHACSLSLRARPVDLSTHPLFSQYFTDFMLFPVE